MAAAKKMKVEMRNGLATVGAVIDDKTVTGLIELQLSGDFLGGGKEMTKDGVMFGRDGAMAGMVLLGDEQDVDGGLGRDVAESENVFVLINDVGLGFAVDDPLEDRFGHRPSFLPYGQFE